MLELPHRPADLHLVRSRAEAQGGQAAGSYIHPVVGVSAPLPPPAPSHSRPSERKIDQIEDRLASIEQLLRNLSVSSGPSAETASRHGSASSRGFTPSATAETSTSSAAAAAAAQDDPEDGESAFEGDSSLAAHTAFASELLEHAVERTSLRDQNPRMSSAVSSLRQIVSMQTKPAASHMLRFHHQKPLPRGGLRELPMPPVQLVVSMCT